MRFIRNKVQTPKQLVSAEKRKTLPFILLLIGVGILIVGVAGFFSAFFFNELIEARWPVRYRDVQTY
jgi:flagellar basal body-associated protein FliL